MAMTDRQRYCTFSLVGLWGLLPLLFLGAISPSIAGKMSLGWLGGFLVGCIALILGPYAGPFVALVLFGHAGNPGFASQVLLYCAPVLMLGVGVQIFRPHNRFAALVQNGLWILGWCGWFAGALVSYAVYLE